MTNRLYYGDNLDVLRSKIASASVDLCYIDPPFDTGICAGVSTSVRIDVSEEDR